MRGDARHYPVVSNSTPRRALPPYPAAMRTTLRCAVCGEVIKPGRTPGTFTHVGRLVAACDMDSDHRPVPERPPPPEAVDPRRSG